MATKLPQEPSTADVEDLLETADKNLDRVKVLYEQYFLGIQKQVPTHLHNDVERRLRDLMQMQLRSTRHRYRLATIQQKFGSYNSYWRRTLRQIENGTYIRNLHKIGREAVRTGAQVPEEILAAMPKRMRDQVIRDREQALALAAKRRKDARLETDPNAEPELEADFELLEPDEDVIALIREPTELRRSLKTQGGAHIIDAADEELDIDAFFKGVEAEVLDVRGAQPAKAPVPAPAPQPRGPVAAPQTVRPNPIAPGAAAARGSVHVEEMRGPFLRTPAHLEESRVPSSPVATAMRTGPALPRAATIPANAVVPPSTSDAPQPPKPDAPPPQVTRTATVQSSPGAPSATVSAANSRLVAPARPGAGAPLPRLPTTPGTQAGAGASPLPRLPVTSGTQAGAGASPLPRLPTTPGTQAANPRLPTTPGTQAAGSRPAATPVASKAGAASPAAGATPPVTGSARIPTISTQTRPAPRAPSSAEANPTAASRLKPVPAPPQRPPPGMTDADVNALYANYVKAKEMVGDQIAPGEHNKLLKTINAQAPKIMQQYNAKAVDFSVVVKDNQVILRAKPKL